MLAIDIALRYLFAKKSHRVVNVIAMVSMAGVAVATAAIVVVLSVFNGFTDLAQSHLAAIDPELKIAPSRGKVLTGADSIVAVLEQRADVAVAAPVIVERALLVTADHQMPVVFKALDADKADKIVDFDDILIDGIYDSVNGLPDSLPAIQASVGVALGLNLRPSRYAAADLYVPRRKGRPNPANPAAAYRTAVVAMTGVVQVDQPEYDAEYIFIPLSLGRQLLDYNGGEASAIEVKAADGVNLKSLKSQLRSLMPDCVVLDRSEQQVDTFRMIALEKWVTFLMLIFILLVAAFNIISTMSLMVIEKQDDMATLRAMGATRPLTRSIFVIEGWLVTAVGGVVGLVAGTLLVAVQQVFGIVKLDADPTTLSIDVYPVKLLFSDLLIVAGSIFAVGLIIGLISRLFTKHF